MKKIRFTIKRPSLSRGCSRRSTFALVRDIKYPDGRRETNTIIDERIVSINKAFKQGTSFNDCLLKMEKLRESFYNEQKKTQGKAVFNSKNRALVGEYLEKIYSIRKIKESSFNSMRHDLINAISCLEDKSIYVATQAEIQKCIDKAFKGNIQRRKITRLNQLLKFIGRDDVLLSKNPKRKEDVRFLELNELEILFKVLERENRPLYLATKIASLAGLRLSEIYGLKKRSIKADNMLFIDKQIQNIKGEYVEDMPKGYKVRHAYVIGELKDDLLEWITLSNDEKESIRTGSKTAKLIKSACNKIWPNDQSKHLTFHDLRHCYAIHLVSKGVTTDNVSKFMGNSPIVCIENYQGFIASSLSFDLVDNLLSR